MSDDYMKYDGSMPEPPYATISDFIDRVDELESQLSDANAMLILIRRIGEEWIRDESLCASYECMSRIYEILNPESTSDEADDQEVLS